MCFRLAVVHSQDWTRPGVAKINKNSVSGLNPGSILLMHDAGGDRSQTVKALPMVIKKIKKQGYSFVTLCN